MQISRRRILQTAAVFGLVGTRSWAATEATFGDIQLTTVSDGKLVLPVAAVVPPGEDAAALLQQVGISGDQVESALNITLLRRGNDVVLFDTGGGKDFVPTAGLLPDGLAAIGVAPEDVTHVIFTHGHPDHLWGVLDEFDEPLFANAAHLMSQVERDFWLDPATAGLLPEDRRTFVSGAARRIEALGDGLATFADGDEVLAGVTARLTPGHTPGHMAFDIHGQALVLGDVVTNAIGFLRPDLPNGFDTDPVLGSATRAAMLGELAGSGMPMIGYHMPGGGIGKVEKSGDGFAFVPS